MRRRQRTLTSIVIAAAVLGACGDDDARPTVASWRDTWETRQALVPVPDGIINGGADLCGERLGVFRTDLPALLPSPAEELDDAVRAWSAHVETIVFECPTDPDELADRYDTLDVLTAEVDAGLDAASG